MYDPDDEVDRQTGGEPRSAGTAYLLAAASVFGLAGLHRFYMGKIGTGILWCLTFGCAGIGLIYDLVTMRRQIDEVNDREGRTRFDRGQGELVERVAFRLARANGGFVTPAQLSLDSNLSVEQAKVELEDLVKRGYADVRVRRDGLVAFVFPDFLDSDVQRSFETF